ncbi:MAG: ABC transporter transmembrane domain-containing protein [Rickettsiales bacterium]|nr:ABC transporter transmembrane domain-containing protein [Rickettsiales bacterium]
MEEIKQHTNIANAISKNFLQESLYACRRAFKYNLFFSFIASIITIATSMYSLQVFDRVLSSSSISTLVALTVITLGLLIALGFIHVVRTFLLVEVSNYINSKLSNKLIDLSISKSAIFSNLQNTQNLGDLNVIKGFLTGAGINSLFDAPWAILYIIAIYFIHPILCLVVLISAACLLLLAYYNEKTLKPILNEANELNVKNTRDLELMNRNAEVIEAMGMKTNIINNFNELGNKIQELQFRASKKSGIISNITKTFRMFVYILSTAVAAYLVIYNKMSPGGMVAVSILSGKALAPFDAAMEIWKSGY